MGTKGDKLQRRENTQRKKRTEVLPQNGFPNKWGKKIEKIKGKTFSGKLEKG